MPASYAIDTRLRVVFSRRWGVLTDRELSAHSRALEHDPRFEPTFRQLADLRDVERFEVSAIGVRALAQLNPFARESRRAGVVGSDASFGILRMYQSSLMGSSDDILVCRSLDEALEWIGLEPSTPWPSEPDWIIGDAGPE